MQSEREWENGYGIVICHVYLHYVCPKGNMALAF